MATYLLWSGGNGTSGTEAGGWAAAYQTFAAAIAAASTDNDIIKVHKAHQEELAGDTTFTFPASIEVICVDKDNSDALSTMDTGGWIGNSTTNRSVSMSAAGKIIYLYGITLRTAGSTSDFITLASSEDSHFEYESCYFWNGNTNVAAHIYIGNVDQGAYAKCKNCTFRFANASQGIFCFSRIEIENMILAGTTPTRLFIAPSGTDTPGSTLYVESSDLSSITGDLTGTSPDCHWLVTFANCKFGSGVTMKAAQTNTNNVSTEVYVFNCSSGDNHYEFGHYSNLGETVAVSSPYVSDGALYDGTNPVTWKITTTAVASFYAPYVSPWMEQYHSGTSAITPYLEGLRINNATVAQNDEVWAEFSAQTTASSTKATIDRTDRMALLGSPANQTSAKTYSDWTASPATDTGDSVFKLTGGSMTPAEIGMLRARVCVGEPSITVYVDPTIRT